MANLTVGVFVAACVVLVVAGVAKVRAPAPVRRAARAIRLPASTAAIVLFGGIEIVVALAGLLIGHAACIAVALVYAFLAAVALRLVRRAPAIPCGCLGAAEAPATVAHVVFNVAAAAVSVLAAFGPSPWSRLVADPGPALVLVVLALCCARLAALTVAVKPNPMKEAR